MTFRYSVVALVGRDRELAELALVLEGAAERRGALAMLVGEPGIGKTSLADAAVAEAERRGFRVGWGRAWESGGAPAYFPWTQALEALGASMPLPSLTTAVESDAARFQLFRGVAETLRALSVASPVLIVLDDLHDADVASLRLLEFLSRDLRRLGIALLGTHRDAEVRRSEHVAEILARVAREGRTVAVRRLDRADCLRLVHSTGESVPDAFDAPIWQATQGNPLFVTEIVRLLEADPTAAQDGQLPIPYGVREVIRQRLALVDDAAREVLEVAAVLGVDFHEATVVAACGKGTASVADALHAAIRFEVLREVDDGRFRFAHALVRDALYRDLTRTRRGTLHGAAATALERAYPSSPPVVEIAHHAIEAHRVERLVERTTCAVRALVDAYAGEDAIALLERAQRMHTAQGTDEGGAAELSLLLGRTKMQGGDLQGGRALCVQVAERARTLGDGALLARAALAFGAELTSGQTDPLVRSLLEEALRELPSGAEGLRVRLVARLAASLQPSPDPPATGRMALEAVHAARALGDDEALLEVLHFAGAALGEAVASPERLPMAREAMRLATALGDRAKRVRAHLRLIFELMEVGDIAGAEAQIDTFESAARATGQARYVWPVPLLRAMRALQEGRFDDADALAKEASDIVAQTSDVIARQSLFMHRFARLRAQERGPELLAMEPELLSTVGAWNDGNTYRDAIAGTVRSIAGDPEDARARLGRVPLDSTPGRIRISLGVFADSVLRAGETTRAQEFYDRLLPEADRWLMFTVSGFAAETTYARLLGGFATMCGRFAEAEAHFRSALALAQAASARPEIGRVLAGYATMCRARGEEGDDERARELFAQARTLAEELGLARLLSSIPAAAAEDPKAATAAAKRGRSSLAITAEGETWKVTFGEDQARLKDSRGMGYLARLVSEPEREIHVLDLAGASEGADVGDAGEVLDPEARAAYKGRLVELDEEVREAQGWNDAARESRARAEIEFLLAELSRAEGLGGRPRRVGSAAERARVAVTRRIRDVISRIGEQSPDLGRHLEAAVKTGTQCAYRPR